MWFRWCVSLGCVWIGGGRGRCESVLCVIWLNVAKGRGRIRLIGRGTETRGAEREVKSGNAKWKIVESGFGGCFF
jgi:hypothetical protein